MSLRKNVVVNYIDRALRMKKNYVDGFYHIFRQSGDHVFFKFPFERHIFFHPDAAKHILKDNAKNYVKGRTFEALRPFLGNGLLNSEGEVWKRQRRTVAPEFTHMRVETYVPAFLSIASDYLKEWLSTSGPRDVAQDMYSLTLRVAGETMFGTDVRAYSNQLSEAMIVSSDTVIRRLASLIKIPDAWPTPRNIRTQQHMSGVHALIDKIIEDRKKGVSNGNDLLSRLLSARDPETGVAMPDQLLRSEILTLLMAGHETTANALSWTWYLLAQHPETLAKLHQELDRVLQGRSPTYEDLVNLPFNRSVILEAMRLYPPAPGLSRDAIEDDRIGDVVIKKGSTVSVVTSVIHRHPDFWTDPDSFRPERFMGPSNRHPFRYFPFGGGPRECIGKTFAMTEMQIVMALLASQVEIQMAKPGIVETDPMITLRPKNGVWVNISKRK